MPRRRAQQTSILDYVGSQAPKASTSSTQANRETIRFTAARVPTQAPLAEGEGAGDEVDSGDEGRFDRFRLENRKTRLDTEEPTYRGETSQARNRQSQVKKKKVLSGYDSEEASADDDPPRNRRRKTSDDDMPLGSSQAREAINAITIDESSSSPESRSPAKSTVSPKLRAGRKRSDVVLSDSSARASSPDQDDPLRTPTQERPRRDPNSSRKRRRLVHEEEDEDGTKLPDIPRAGPGPSTRSAIKRKTRSGGPITPPSPLRSSGEPHRTRKKTRQVDYYESDDPLDLLIGHATRGKGKGKMMENPDDAVFEAETSPSQSQSQSMERRAVKTGVRDAARRNRSNSKHSPSVENEQARAPPGRPTTKLKIFSSESEAEPAPVMRGWTSTPPEDTDEEVEVKRDRRPKVKEARRKKARAKDPDESGEEIDQKELLEEIALDQPVVLKSRMRDRTKKSAFERNLARLKRKCKKEAKRLGQPYEEVPTTEESDDAEDESDDAKDEHEDAGQIVIDGSDDEGEKVNVINVDDEEDFIDDDSEMDELYDDRLLPAQFRMSSHQDLEHHFKVISQYFIHLVVSGPDFAREADTSYFKTALEAFRRRFQGMKDSLITSSVWKPKFKESLEIYPELIIGTLDEALMGCDACHLSGRMSKYEGRLEGSAYDPETFEDIDTDGESDDGTVGGLEEEMEPPSKGPFKLGKYCQERARVFHEFTHWEHELYFAYRAPYRTLLRQSNAEHSASQELDSDEEVKEVKKFVPVHGFTAETIRDGDEVLEHFERRGYIKMEWQRMSRLMEDARNLEIRR